MSVINEMILSKLICSSCKKYLSVFPIYVYHNKNIKCGRCSVESKYGTRSKLYELVTEQLRFPCINHFESCNHVLCPSEMKQHENLCIANEYGCPLCADYTGIPYDLLYHMKMNHKNAELESKCFLIDIDKGLNSETYFSCGNSTLIIVGYHYDNMNRILNLHLNILGNKGERIKHKFILFTIQNIVNYNTGNIEASDCSQNMVQIDISNHKYPKNIIFCKFDMWCAEDYLEKYQCKKTIANTQCNLPPIIDGSCDAAVMKFSFYNISEMKANENKCSDFKYFVGKNSWSLVIRRCKTGGIKYLSVFLNRESNLEEKVKVFFIISLISHTPLVNNNVEKQAERVYDTNKDWGWTNFEKWDSVLKADNGFNVNNSINFEVKINVSSVDEDICPQCKRSM